MVVAATSDVSLWQRAWDAASRVVDPEIPVLTIADLGVLREVTVTEDAIRARYDQLYARRPVTEEVRARHILASTEAEARAIPLFDLLVLRLPCRFPFSFRYRLRRSSVERHPCPKIFRDLAQSAPVKTTTGYCNRRAG